MSTSQKLALAVAILSFLAGAGTQLTDIFAPLGILAPIITKEIVSVASFAAGILGVFLSFMTSQSGSVRAVEQMPGVSRIVTNQLATDGLKAMADSDEHPKVEPPKKI